MPASVRPARLRPSAGPSLAVGLLAGALALVGCGSGHDMSSMPAGGSAASSAPAAGAPAGTPAPGPHNDADVRFATGMIPHHAQAIQMADLAKERADTDEVKHHAAKVKSAQAPEIQQLGGWLTGWGAPVPATSGSMAMDHGAGDHGGMVGMMSEQEMSALAAAGGTAFERLWLQMMIKHHEGAVTMARTQLAEGGNPAAKEMAQAIVTSQSAEIATMKGLLPSRGA